MDTKKMSECCPEFDPGPWDANEFRWENEQFVRDRVRSVFHIPLNFASVMKRNVTLIEAADAKPSEMVVLSDENSLWGADVYLHASKDVPGAKMATISGTFLSKVFEGPYKEVRNWMVEMKDYVASRGKAAEQIYCYYTTCPKCAKKYGKNYVVLLARV